MNLEEQEQEMERTLQVSDSERELDELRKLNDELKNDLVESATVGQNILSRNNELEEQLREQGEYYSAKQEVGSTYRKRYRVFGDDLCQYFLYFRL